MSRSTLSSLARMLGITLATAMALQSAGAQPVSASFYAGLRSPDNPLLPLPGAPAFCTTQVGASDGFFLAFNNAATRAALCGANAFLLDPASRQFTARFTGTLWVGSSGIYTLAMSADDGDVFNVNGITYDNEPFTVKGGGPGTVDVFLNAGSNKFVLDMNNIIPTGSFVRLLTTGTPVSVSPEPSSVVLMASGMAGLGMVGWRRRRRQRV